MNKYLLLALLFVSALTAMSQEAIMLEGQVLNDTIDKANLTIVNLSLKRGTITSSNGQFAIEARLNDTINISAVQYEPRQFVVNETMYNRGKITLYLIPKITELDQVNISNIDLTGDITKDIGSTTYEPKITPTDLGIPENTAPPRTVEERRYHTAISSGGGIPIDGLINSITGRLKMLKKHIEVSRFEKLVQESRYTFSDSIYMNELNIEKEYIEDFVYYTFEDPKAKELVDTNNALGLLDFMIEKSAAYRSLMNKN
ncbi:hypothetical protein [Dokdonia sp. R86516]|uniref:hypothetical protein n=1 Tax=Dokdonia sp. R86516 TaxID=3093856 RepID=UPI0037CA338E